MVNNGIAPHHGSAVFQVKLRAGADGEQIPDFTRKIRDFSLAGVAGRAFTHARVRRLPNINNQQTHIMAKALSKSQIAATLAEKVQITKKQSVQFLDELAALAYKNAKNSFTVPGLGKLVLVNRKARIGRNPATGEQIQIPAKRVVKFRVAKAAKDAILGSK
jgi:DNA-binding protein HU-beta